MNIKGILALLLISLLTVSFGCAKVAEPVNPGLPTPTPTITQTAVVTPTVTLTSTMVVVTLAASKDAGSDEAVPAANYGTCPNFSIGGINGSKRYGYYRFDTSSIPAGVTLSSAVFYFTHNAWDPNNGGMILRPLPVNFAEGTKCGATGAGESTWDNYGAGAWPVGYTGGTNIALIGPPSVALTDGNVTMTASDLTPVQQWLNDSSTNNGIVMINMGNSIAGYIYIYNKEEGAAEKTAKLKLTYQGHQP